MREGKVHYSPILERGTPLPTVLRSASIGRAGGEGVTKSEKTGEKLLTGKGGVIWSCATKSVI